MNHGARDDALICSQSPHLFSVLRRNRVVELVCLYRACYFPPSPPSTTPPPRLLYQVFSVYLYDDMTMCSCVCLCLCLGERANKREGGGGGGGGGDRDSICLCTTSFLCVHACALARERVCARRSSIHTHLQIKNPHSVAD